MDFAFTVQRQEADSFLINQISLRDYDRQTGQIRRIDACSSTVQERPTETVVLASRGIPVGFEYSFQESNLSFKNLALVGNTCPYHEAHMKPGGGSDVLAFYLVDKDFNLGQEASVLDLEDASTFTKLPQPLVIAIQDDEHLQTGTQFYRKLLVANNYAHFAITYENWQAYGLQAPDEPLSLSVWSLFQSREGYQVPLDYLEYETSTSQKYFLLRFTSEAARWPTSARHDYLKVQLSYGDSFSYSQVIEVSYVDFDPLTLGTATDGKKTCYYEEPSFDAFNRGDNTFLYEESTVSDYDLKSAYRIEGSSTQQTIIACCVDSVGSVVALEAKQIDVAQVNAYWQEFTSRASSPTRACQGAIAPTSAVAAYALSQSSGQGAYTDYSMFSSQENVWKSACQGQQSASAPEQTADTVVTFYEATTYGPLIGVSTISSNQTDQINDAAASREGFIVHVTQIFNRCLETPLTVRQSPQLYRFEPEDDQSTDILLTQTQFAPLLGFSESFATAIAQPNADQDFISLGYCSLRSCLFDTVNPLDELQVSVLDESGLLVRLPAWRASLWNFNQLIYTTLMQTFEATPTFNFKFARRLWVIVYEVPDLQETIRECQLQQRFENVSILLERDSTGLQVLDSRLNCSQKALDLLAEIQVAAVTKLWRVESGERMEELEGGERLYFAQSDARSAFTIEQETTLYFSEQARGLVSQSPEQLKSEKYIESITLEATLYSVQVETCTDMVVFLSEGLNDMTVKATGDTNVPESQRQRVSQELRVGFEGQLSQEATCRQGLRYELDTRGVFDLKVLGLIQDKYLVLSAPEAQQKPTQVTIAIFFETTLLLEESFTVEVTAPDPPAQEQVNEPPSFQGLSSYRLPLWKVSLAQTQGQEYALPEAVDVDSPVLNLRLLISDKTLRNCDCLKIDSIERLVFTVPEQGQFRAEISDGRLVQVKVQLSDEKSTTSYDLLLVFTDQYQEEPMDDEIDLQIDQSTDAQVTTPPQPANMTETEADDQEVPIPPANQTMITGTVASPLKQQATLKADVYFELEQFAFNPWDKRGKSKKHLLDSQGLCVPVQLKASAKGAITVRFSKPIALRSTEASFIDEVKKKGSIQTKLLTSTPAESQDSFDFEWSLAIGDQPEELVFDIDFARPEMISASGVYPDQLQIVFVETEDFLECVRRESQPEKRELSSQKILERQAKFVPPFYTLMVDLPAQKGGNTTVAVVLEELIDSIANTTEASVYSGFSVSQLVKLPMQFVWAGINSVQLISHLPLFQIMFPANSVDFFNYLATVVSFDVFPPTERYDFGFSPSEPFSMGFETLDYETVNFFDALGSISLILIFIVLRITVQPLLVALVSCLSCKGRCRCCRKYCRLRASTVTNIWIRFLLETYLELVISSLLGIKLKEAILADEMNNLDWLALYGAYFTLGIWVAFVLLVAFLSLCSASSIVEIRKKQIKEFEAKAKKDFYADEKTKERFGWVFRSKTFLSKKQISNGLKRGKSLPDEELRRRVELADRKVSSTVNRSFDHVTTRRFDEEDESMAKPQGGNDPMARSMTESLKISLESIDLVSVPNELPMAPNSVEGFQERDAVSKAATARNGHVAAAPLSRNLTSLISQSHEFQSSSQSSLPVGQEVNGGFEEPPGERMITEEPLMVKKGDQPHDPLPQQEEQAQTLTFPGWYKYASELFLHLDHKYQMSLQVCLFFLLRRIGFVLVAMYVRGSPAFQAAAFVQLSILQCALLVAQQPYETPLFNALETTNEFTVLTIGYHVIVLIFEDLKVQTRERLGLSMMGTISTMIALNGLNWLYHLLKQIWRTLRRLYYTTLRFKRKKQLKRLSLVREKAKSLKARNSKSEHGRKSKAARKGHHTKTESAVELLEPVKVPIEAPSEVAQVDTIVNNEKLLRPISVSVSIPQSPKIDLPETLTEPQESVDIIATLNDNQPAKQPSKLMMDKLQPSTSWPVQVATQVTPSATKRKSFGQIELPSNAGAGVARGKTMQAVDSAVKQMDDYSGLSVANFEHQENSERIQVSINEIDFELSKESEVVCVGPHNMVPARATVKRTPVFKIQNGRPTLVTDAIFLAEDPKHLKDQEGAIPKPAKRSRTRSRSRPHRRAKTQLENQL